MRRVVFDTVVFVRALINPSGRWGRLVFEHGERYQLFVSAPTVREILEVLHRPQIRSRARGEASMDVQRRERIVSAATHVEIGEVPPISRDPKDDVFLATAAVAGADFLVSEDNDLLVLGTYGDVRIVTASVFLDLLEQIDG